MKLLIRFLAISIILLGQFSCDGDGYSSDPTPIPTTTTFTAVLTGAREVPPNGSTATGTATLTFNNTTKTFTLTVTHNVVAPTAAHIHKGAVGAVGSPVFPSPTSSFTFPITSYVSPALTPTEEADLKAELYYVNIHSAAYPGGEIRGQLFRQGAGGGSY
ncbi:CHRD domain-containing protein [Flavobacterium sp. ZB4R12]|uniref:CHRD domain-containing protein n=1 Tax=Flavobacterium sp. ZB4R12 TaxID=3398732 RepID=UPI003AAEDE6A